MRYRLNRPDVIQETVDGEALIIHTTSGIYFSVEGTGEYVWNALLAGHTVDEIVGASTDSGAPVSAELSLAITHFAQQLQDEELIVPTDSAAPSGAAPRATQPFVEPVLQKYTDMQELLLVDPIHEVDPQAGWPQRLSEN